MKLSTRFLLTALAGALLTLFAACSNEASPGSPSPATTIAVSPTPTAAHMSPTPTAIHVPPTAVAASPTPVAEPVPTASTSGTAAETPVAGSTDLSGGSVCVGPPPSFERPAPTLAGKEPPAVAAGFSRGIYSVDRDGGSLQLLTERRDWSSSFDQPGPPNTYQWSPDGTRMAFLVADGFSRRTISLLDVSTGLVTSVPSPDIVWDFNWSPDGRLLAVHGRLADKEGIYLADLDSGAMTLLPLETGDQSPVIAPTWSPNGQCLALWLSDTTVIVRPDGTLIATIPDARQAAWSPDGSRLAFEVIDEEPMAIYAYDLVVAETSLKLAEGSQPSWQPDGDRILFEQYLEEGTVSALFAVSVEGGPPVELGEGSAPAWSPDGATLAFIRDGNLHLAAGGEERQLTQSPYPYIDEPRWSPDGQHLTFSYSPQVDSDVYVARADGTGETWLAPGFEARWSPNGQRIAFVAGTGALGFWGSIYTVGTDGQAPVRLTNIAYSDVVFPCHNFASSYSWSPDGSLIAFDTDSFFGGQGHGSFVVPADGSSTPVKVGDGFDPSWSPDGKRVAFSVFEGSPSPGCTIFVTSRSGAERKSLTAGLAPAWSPDSARIAFSRADGVYVINADRSGERRLFHSQGGTTWPGALAWSPDGRRLAFGANSKVYVVDASGDGLPVGLGAGGNPVWLPDGRRIAVVVYENNKPHVDIVAADGSGVRQRFLEASRVSWSPDGSQIVFSR